MLDVDDEDSPWWERLRPLLTAVPDSVNPFELAGRVVVYVVFFLWGISFLRMPVASADQWTRSCTW